MAHPRRVPTGAAGVVESRLRPLVSALGVVAVVGLVLLHVSILWARVTQGRLGEPAIALRWGAALVLLLGLLALRRRGVSLLWGRRALVFWLLVLVLHAGTGVPQQSTPRVAPEQLLFVLPAVAPACLLLVVLATPRAAAALTGPAFALPLRAAAGVPVRRRGFRLALASRPPPA